MLEFLCGSDSLPRNNKLEPQLFYNNYPYLPLILESRLIFDFQIE